MIDLELFREALEEYKALHPNDGALTADDMLYILHLYDNLYNRFHADTTTYNEGEERKEDKEALKRDGGLPF